MSTKPSRVIQPASTELHPVPDDLLDGWQEVGMLPQHQRLLVAGYALTDGTFAGHAVALRRARELYDLRAPGLLERPTRRLTVGAVIAELERLLNG